MQIDLAEVARVAPSSGYLYFLKYLFIGLLMWMVYHFMRVVLTSVAESSRQGRLAWQRSLQRRARVSVSAAPVAIAGFSTDGAAGPETLAGANELTVGPDSVGPDGTEPAGAESDIDDSDSEASLDKTTTVKKRDIWGALFGRDAAKRADDGESSEDDVVSYDETSGESEGSGHGFLEIIDGPTTNVRRVAVEGDITIGRARSCTVRVRDIFTSSRHAKVSLEGDQVVLSDLGSRNGTFLGDARLTKPITLQDGDTFSVGDAVFCYRRD